MTKDQMITFANLDYLRKTGSLPYLVIVDVGYLYPEKLTLVDEFWLDGSDGEEHLVSVFERRDQS